MDPYINPELIPTYTSIMVPIFTPQLSLKRSRKRVHVDLAAWQDPQAMQLPIPVQDSWMEGLGFRVSGLGCGFSGFMAGLKKFGNFRAEGPGVRLGARLEYTGLSRIITFDLEKA